MSKDKKTTKKFKLSKRNKNVLLTLLAVMLMAVGVLGTLQYQKTIDDIKSDGVTEFVLSSCKEYTNEQKTEFWLECEPTR